MGRRATIFWHAALSVAAGVLYFFFVLPRWPELMGDTSHGLGTAARIVGGVFIALAALPIVFTLLELRKPEFGTPALALTLRTAAVIAHVVAGVLIVGTAISEIWLSLDSVGQWLFGVYGAAAAIALLGIAAFYLSFVAEQPPAPPKPLKLKKDKKEKRQRRLRRKQDDDADEAADSEADSDELEAEDAEGPTETADGETEEAGKTEETAADEASPDVETTATEAESRAEEAAPADESTEPADAETAPAETAETEPAESESESESESGILRNRRPSGKGTHRRRSRRGVVVDE
jgi:hypothetical protein